LTAPAHRLVYVISDLHIGGAETGVPGRRGFRIFTQAHALSRFIDCLVAKPATNPSIELVINGDFIDLLAEADPGAGGWSALKAPLFASAALKDLVRRPCNRDVFTSLRNFLARGHTLTVLLGNHDVELSFPDVRRTLQQELGLNHANQLQFLYDGEAYVIGDVLIEHGNRYDEFNTNDYNALRVVRSLQSRRIDVPERNRLVPSAGSELVATVINPLKEKYPFLDLLKPETEAVVPLLLALEPAVRGQLLHVMALKHRARGHGMRTETIPALDGDIGASLSADLTSQPPGNEANVSPSAMAERELNAILQQTFGSDGAAGEFLSALTPSMQTNLETDISASARDAAMQLIGVLQLLLQGGTPTYKQRLPALLRAVRAAADESCFDPSSENCKAYRDAVAEFAASGFKIILFGHTHLARDMRIHGARYLNTGSWADRIRFPAEILGGTEKQALAELGRFLDCIRDRERFEGALAGGELPAKLEFEPMYARLAFDDANTVLSADLCKFSEGSGVA
jgi:UDP-2,3-diacylglucosamine pyrophosphatase LpxH